MRLEKFYREFSQCPHIKVIEVDHLDELQLGLEFVGPAHPPPIGLVELAIPLPYYNGPESDFDLAETASLIACDYTELSLGRTNDGIPTVLLGPARFCNVGGEAEIVH
jgi:hypothetical protein